MEIFRFSLKPHSGHIEKKKKHFWKKKEAPIQLAIRSFSSLSLFRYCHPPLFQILINLIISESYSTLTSIPPIFPKQGQPLAACVHSHSQETLIGEYGFLQAISSLLRSFTELIIYWMSRVSAASKQSQVFLVSQFQIILFCCIWMDNGHIGQGVIKSE